MLGSSSDKKDKMQGWGWEQNSGAQARSIVCVSLAFDAGDGERIHGESRNRKTAKPPNRYRHRCRDILRRIMAVSGPSINDFLAMAAARHNTF
ncbi:hypothetical protein E4U43_003568 [Claviceps pusilla]|uniref:Uncharacterized protein n=1 Tax=Claviceps pusilla TaxID=123648 RepID=A0A9P7NHJ6_9HYPO|nr:hypothetical protein E4U43_003568 [Claviceps pusilla]